ATSSAPTGRAGRHPPGGHLSHSAASLHPSTTPYSGKIVLVAQITGQCYPRGGSDVTEWHRPYRHSHGTNRDVYTAEPAMTSTAQQSLAAFVSARDFLLDHQEDYDTAYANFRWPELDEFNWALDWFDSLAVASASAQRPALWIVEQDGSEATWTFEELSHRS